MSENIVRKTGPAAQEISEFDTNDAVDGEANDPYFDSNVITEPILTTEDFTSGAIIAKKLDILANQTDLKKASPLTQFEKSDIEIIDVDVALNKTRLSQEDFTPEAIARDTTESNSSTNIETSKLPDYSKIEATLPANNKSIDNDGFSPTIPNYPEKVANVNTPDSRQAETTYKIKPEAQPKKSFFVRFVPKFISRFF